MAYNAMTGILAITRTNYRPAQCALLLGLFLFVLCLPLSAKNMTWDTRVMENSAFNQAFLEYYDALADYQAEDLRFELFETIEDSLSAGSHMTIVSLDHKVEQIEAGIFEQLRQSLCHLPATPNNLKTLKRMAGRSIVNTGNHMQVNFSFDELGMLVGVLTRLIQQTPHHQFCETD